jgi:hypothetical protein
MDCFKSSDKAIRPSCVTCADEASPFPVDFQEEISSKTNYGIKNDTTKNTLTVIRFRCNLGETVLRDVASSSSRRIVGMITLLWRARDSHIDRSPAKTQQRIYTDEGLRISLIHCREI